MQVWQNLYQQVRFYRRLWSILIHPAYRQITVDLKILTLFLKAGALPFYSKAERIYLRNSNVRLLPYWDCIILLLALLIRVVLIRRAQLPSWLLSSHSQQLLPSLFLQFIVVLSRKSCVTNIAQLLLLEFISFVELYLHLDSNIFQGFFA